MVCTIFKPFTAQCNLKSIVLSGLVRGAVVERTVVSAPLALLLIQQLHDKVLTFKYGGLQY